jgi:hypothetical protein
MNPLSITGTVIAILQLTGTSIEYLSDIKDASKEYKQCNNLYRSFKSSKPTHQFAVPP